MPLRRTRNDRHIESLEFEAERGAAKGFRSKKESSDQKDLQRTASTGTCSKTDKTETDKKLPRLFGAVERLEARGHSEAT